MSTSKIKTLLLLSSATSSYSFSFLFRCAKFWAQQGNRVLFISKTPLKNLPLAVGKKDPPLNPDTFKLIQFMYLANWEELLQQLYSIHLRHNPVSVIIVKNLENYFQVNTETKNHEEHVSFICASLLYAASICAKLTSQAIFLINDYVCEDSTIEKNIVKSFFHNIWQIEVNKDKDERTIIKLSRLFFAVNNDILFFSFNEDLEESMLTFKEIVKKVIEI